MKRTLSGIMLTLLLISILALAFNIQPVQAEPRIIIVPDDYPTIQEAINNASDGDSIFTRAGTYYENVVIRKTVSLIGESNSTTIIYGSGTESVVLVQANNVTISHFTIQNGGNANAGVFIDRYYKNNVVHGNIITSNKWCGIFLDRWSTDNIIDGNTIFNNGYGLRLFGSDKNTFTKNTIVNNPGYGIIMDISSGNYFRNNEIAGNIFNFEVVGYSLSEYIHDIDTSNTVNGKPIYYWIDKHDMEIPADAGYVAAVNSTNITVKHLHLTNNGQGVLLAYTNSSLISKVNASNNVYAIYLYSSSNNTMVCNNLLNNNNGMYIYDSSNFNLIVANTIAFNNANGIYAPFSSNNMFYHNNLVDNEKYQVQVGNYSNSWDDGYPSGGNYWSDYIGVDLYSGPYQNETGSDGIGDTPHVINENNIDDYPLMGPWTDVGENVTVTHACGVSLTFANVTSSGITTVNETQSGPDPPSGFKLATEGSIYYDVKTTANFTENIRFSIAYDDTNLIEEEENALQLLKWNEALQQWINITTHVDTENNIIYGETSDLSIFAIIAPLIHDIAIIKVTPSKTVVGEGFTLHINITITNHGDSTETSNVTLYVNTTSIASQTVILTSDTSTILHFTLNTTGFVKGNYTIKVVADTVPSETDTADNTCIDGWVGVTILGDVNGDFKCEGKDNAYIAKAYDTLPGDPLWNPNADINDDGKVEGKDVAIIAKYYNTQYP